MLCLDELGPLGAKVYPGRQWCPAGQRPGYTPNYGKRGGLWVLGAFEPATGLALTQSHARRTRYEFIDLLNEMVLVWPEGNLVLILDNLSVHKTIEVRLWALAHPRVSFLFQPRYAPWLNLIEPWWKTLRHLALKGRSFDSLTAVESSIANATRYWNSVRKPYQWRKPA